ncbi:MAG: mechanosensitive ion channel family protein [Myxococcota bacterium]|jgi:miniconductance mechanosensitive channel|nr:mechanosensitive ion channel family protein [Myxococcota bacterium]
MPDWLAAEWARTAASLAGLIALSGVAYGLARWGVVFAVRRAIARTTNAWDDAFAEARVFTRLANIAPALVVYYGIGLIPGLDDTVDSGVERLATSAMVLTVAAAVTAGLNAANTIYSRSALHRQRPIKGYLQVIEIVVLCMAALAVGAILLDESPWVFVSGIGAVAAVLMLVFKDTILSLVASVQIASNDMIHLGDWIEMPQAGVDGDVTDIALHTVKVQNWDKTISTVPTYKFITESFKNWRGMSESGGRRIKRAINLDLNSIRFLREGEIEKLKEWELLHEYLASKVGELKGYNAEAGRNPEINADIRRLTNIGTFRAYVAAYLTAHPKIHTDGFTFIVRQLPATASGLPLEIYCFSNDQDWTRYEGIQSDIFDHIFAMVPEFSLRLFQDPTGADFSEWTHPGERPEGV